MRHVLAAFTFAFVVCVAMVSPPLRTAIAQAPAPAPAPTPPADCAACVQCIAACGAAYAACTQKCLTQPNVGAQQACVAGCPPVTTCAQSCSCSGCGTVPGLPH